MAGSSTAVAATDILATTARAVLLFAGLLLPGAAWLRVLRIRAGLSGCFIGSAATLYLTVVLYDLLHVPISLTSMSVGLAVVTAGAGLVAILRARKSPSLPPPEPAGRPLPFLTDLGFWTPLLAVFWLFFSWRLGTQPLNGGDVDFRWSWLAEQMLHHGSLSFYPPRSAADFTSYFWVESIPPGVASLHGWAYACAGRVDEVWASAGGLMQMLALHDLAWRLGALWGGRETARRAVVLVAALPLLNWSVLLGQETGLTAVAVAGITFAAFRWRASPEPGWLGLAVLAGVLGASTREYGLIFPIYAAVLLRLFRAPARTALAVGGIALALGLIWPVRTWVLTGNPFYSLRVARFFALNGFFVDWSETISLGSHRLLFTAAAWQEVGRYLLLGAPLATLGWAALLFSLRRRAPEALGCLLGIGLTFALWYASVPYTGGGLFYSMRVLSPALLLGAVFGASALDAAKLPASALRLADIAIVVAAGYTLPITLTLPHHPYKLSPDEWPEAGLRFVDDQRQADAEVARHLDKLPGHGRILSECVSLPRALAPDGVTVVPLWSPEVSWLFDHGLAPDEVARRWARSGLRYVVMTRSPAQLTFLARRAVWLEPWFHIRREWQSDRYLVLEVTVTPDAKP
ncbi:MAG TPA: hypothetical protein PLB90_02535 [Opitutaceae bacterium]|nr:hypothetical protein [Opitutaceae bacterium]